MRADVGSTSLPREGEKVCGDVGAVFPFEAGLLLCLADGLGHGEHAHAAAARACACVGENVSTQFSGPRLEGILRLVGREIAPLRGAAVSMVSIELNHGRIAFIGVGNVELRSVSSARIAPPTMPGIVGQRFRMPRVWEYPIAPGDIVSLTTDGVSNRFELAKYADLSAQGIADALVGQFRKPHDDAFALVARIEKD